ncbi:oleate hydratase [Penicillium brevicompactum]|uniref:Oleate hydratase n=1 Tax=Penicillium brevicompactum TaxID=5074 RepID=A0A9W9Q7R5_PENBR|nr:oleate hydratase [Penicillium brevicompactum]
MYASTFSVRLKVRIQLAIFILKPEKSFINSRLFGLPYFHDFQSLSAFIALDCYRYNPHKDVIRSITSYLQNKGVAFRFNSKAINLTIYLGRDSRAISAIKYTQDKTQSIVSVSSRDVIIVSPRSIISRLTRGTNSTLPLLEFLDAEDNLDKNWAL